MSLLRQINLLRNPRNAATPNFYRVLSTKGIPLLYEKDPQPIFTDPETQKLLKSITQLKISKIFRKRTVKDNSVEYKFMTTEELLEEFVKTVERAKLKLQMPPVVKIKEDEQILISEDKALKGFSNTKFIFTDITFGKRHTDRKVIERDTDGVLRYASMEVAKRMKQLYAPLDGRKILTPRMFEDEHLQRCLEEHKYEFVLDRLIVQYDPYEPEFHSISSKVYQHLNESREFDQLRSTRHFGPMAFFYAWHKSIDDLLYDMVKRDYLRNGAELIALYYKIHSVSENYSEILATVDQHNSAEETALKELKSTIKPLLLDNISEEIEKAIGKTERDFELDELCLTFIERYVAQHALKKVQLELAIQTLKEINSEKKQLYFGLNKAHGIQQSS